MTRIRRVRIRVILHAWGAVALSRLKRCGTVRDNT